MELENIILFDNTSNNYELNHENHNISIKKKNKPNGKSNNDLLKDNCNKSENKPKSVVKKPVVDYQINEKIMDSYLTKYKDLSVSKIFKKNSTINDDTGLICMLIHHKIITDYECTVKSCRVKNKWLRKPIILILNRKNNCQTDVRVENLELLCPNCYIQNYGMELFIKKKNNIIPNCQFCDYPLSKFSAYRQKKKICPVCDKKILDESCLTQKHEQLEFLKQFDNNNKTNKFTNQLLNHSFNSFNTNIVSTKLNKELDKKITINNDIGDINLLDILNTEHTSNI